MLLTVHGTRLNVIDRGEGDAVVFLHGTGCNARNWEPQLAALEFTHRVVAIDARGHGGSDPAEGSTTLQDYADDVLAAMSLLGIDRAPLVGLSIGGTIALLVALTAPERVSGLVLANSIARLDDQVSAGMKAGGAAAMQYGMKAAGEGARPALFSAAAIAENRPYIQEFEEQFATTDPGSFVIMTEAMVGLDLMDRLGQISAPTLVLVGNEDLLLPTECSTAIAAAIPGSEIQEIPGASHMSNLDQPQIFADHLVRFLSRIA